MLINRIIIVLTLFQLAYCDVTKIISYEEALKFAKKVRYKLDIKRVIIKKLALAVADGVMSVDGKQIYSAKDLKVGLFQSKK